MLSKSEQGKKNRAAGARFERKVRKDLEEKRWIVDRWSNNVCLYRRKPKDVPIKILLDLEPKEGSIGKALESNRGKVVPAKSMFGMRTTGFPDFIAFQDCNTYYDKRVIGVEVKSNGYLDKIEKEKCKWLLDNHIFSKILIASKGKKRGEILYKEFK